MDSLFDIPTKDLSFWLDGLKPYQRKDVLELIQIHGEEIAAEKWLSAYGFSNTIPFGGQSDSKPFFAYFKEEFTKFICGHPDYEEQREKIKSQGEIVSAVTISYISIALSSKIGMTSALLSPAVALLLFTAGKIGLKAYCKTSNINLSKIGDKNE
jgi:hypothetical protein